MMKCLFIHMVLVVFFTLMASPIFGFKPMNVAERVEDQEKARIKIMEFVPDNYISGKIVGIPASEYARYKVIVYVKTDKWYLHPYDSGGEGLSYAAVSKYGTWRINTIKRTIAADQVAFFLVNRDYAPPTMVNDLNAIAYRLVHIEKGGGRI